MAVPHLLIMEFFAAVYLVGNKEAWTELFEEVDGKCKKGKTRRSLEDVVRELGLENVIRFAVGLSSDVPQQLHTLFVIKPQKSLYLFYVPQGGRIVFRSQSDYSYQLQLLQESKVKLAMAQALCNAPVITASEVHGYAMHRGADHLLDVFTEEQSHQFLARAYDCEVKFNSVRGVIMSRKNIDRVKDSVCDSYVVRCLLKFRCTALEMGENMWVEDSDISVDLLTLLISAVSERLCIDGCRLLCAESGEHIHRLLLPMPAPTLREIWMRLRDTELSVNVLRLLISAVSENLLIDGGRLLCAESGEHIHRLLEPMPAPTLREMHMELRGSELSVIVLRMLISAVSEKLSVGGCRLICAESGEHIQRLLQPMPAPTLREIYMELRGTELFVSVLRLLILAVSENLSIIDCRLLYAESGGHIHTLLQPLPAPTLREIFIHESELSADALRLLISAVSEKLSINDCRLLCAESGEHIQRLLQPMPVPTVGVIGMGLRGSELSMNVLRLLISAVSEKLFPWGCRLLCAESGDHIQRLLQSMPPPTLREISTGESELSVDAVRMLISAVSEKLSIHDCRLMCAESGEHIQTLLQPMPAPTLREIYTAESELSVDALRLLVSAVSEKLSIYDCRLMCAESGDHIQRLLQPMPAPTLREIHMGLRGSELSVNVLRLLISAVSEKLFIDDCSLLCAESVEHIHRLLQPMPAPTLHEISIGKSEVSVDALRLLTSAVSGKLIIRGSRLLCAKSAEHIQRLMQSMPAPALRKVSIHDNELSLDALRLLTLAVRVNLSIHNCRLICAESQEHMLRMLQPLPAPKRRAICMELGGSEFLLHVLRLLISAVSEKLSINNCMLQCAESGEHIQRLLQPMIAPRLRQIFIGASELSVDALRLLISAVSEKPFTWDCRLLRAELEDHMQTLLQILPAPTIREVSIHDNDLSVDALRLIISAVSGKVITRSCRSLCAESVDHVHRLLQPMPAPTLHDICIELRGSELSLDVLQLLISAVSENLSIISCRLLCAESGAHIQRLLQPIPAATLSVICMVLRGSKLSVDALQLLISAVSEKLSIDDCRLLCAGSGEHIQRLLQPMPAPTLREISIDASELSVDALRLLISAVSENLSIKKCTLLYSGKQGGGGEVVFNTKSVPAPIVRVTL